MTNNTPATPLDCLFYGERRRPDTIWLTQPLPDGRVRQYLQRLGSGADLVWE